MAFVRQWPHRVWAVEGANGTGRPLAQRLLADGEDVLDVPAKLAARVRVFDTGQGRKTDATDAHSIATVALRTQGLRRLQPDERMVALRLLCDRRDELARLRVQTVNRLHRLLAELIPGGASRDLSADKARRLLATVRPQDLAGSTRRRMAVEELADLVAVDAKLKALKKELAAAVVAAGSGLMRIHGIGPAGAARILADVGDVARFPDRNRFASWTGTAPLEASSGEQVRHRLSRAGNRRLNHVLHIAAIVQLRHDTPGRAYYRRKRAEGKTAMEALRCLRRRISDAVYRQLVADATRMSAERHELEVTGPGGQTGAALSSSAADLTPVVGSSDQPQPGPADPDPTPARRPSTKHSSARSRRPSRATARSRGQAPSA
uniref:IS110 family transposase n=1 Tax=Motilibacter deserti TaxID=2714956 RepID=UPI002F2B69DD